MSRVDAVGAGNLGQAVADQRQRAQAEEVHLEQPDPLDLLHVPLRGDFVARPFIERRVVGDRPGRNHHACGVHRGVARHPFQPPPDVEHFLDLGVLPGHLLQHRVLGQRLVQRHVERRRNLLGDAVHVGVGHVERAADVAHHGLGLHGAERDDLRDVLAPVLARDVLDHFSAPALAEVHVDVGQRHALGVEEALEDEVEVDRIDVGDAHAPRHQRAGGRAAARANRDRLLAGVADEVPDDQEVAAVAHPLHHLDLVVETALVLVDRVGQAAFAGELPQARQPLLESLARHLLEVLVQRRAWRHVEAGQVVDPLRDRDVAALGNPDRVRQRIGVVSEHRLHLLGGLEKELIAGVAQALGVVDGLARADAQQDVVRLRVALPQVVDVVGGHERQVQLAGQGQDALVDDLLLLDTLVLHLQEEVARAQDVAQPRRRFQRRPRLFDLERARHLPLQAAAEADEPLGVLGQQILVDSRPVVEPFGIARRHQLDQVLVALVGLGQQHQVVGFGLRSALLEAAALRHVDLAAEDRLDAAGARVVVEDHRREHVAVLGDRERRHVELDRFVQQLVDAAGAVEERKLGVQVQVNEVRHSHSIVEGGFEEMS